MTLLYLDSSALLKLVVLEAESARLRTTLADAELIASDLVLAEVPRALGRRAPEPVWSAGWVAVLGSLRLVTLDRPLLTRSAKRPPPELRTLDAVHLESALLLGPDLDAVVGYDRRLLAACTQAGLAVLSPGQI